MTRNHFIHLRMTKLLERSSSGLTRDQFIQAVSETARYEAEEVAKIAPFDESNSAPYSKHVFIGSPGDNCSTCRNLLFHPNHFIEIP